MTPREPDAAVLLLGTGVVGSAFLDAVGGSAARGGVRIAGVANRRGAILATGAAPLAASAIAELRGGARRAPREEPAGDGAIVGVLLRALARQPRPVLVDATAAEGMARTYALAAALGVRVVTANKRPFARDLATYQALAGAVVHDATVGAGLPVLRTLRELLASGDRVERLECVLSGTLSFVANAIHAGATLEGALAIASARGLTEPDPREDLDGVDAARKALILARALGAPLELGDVAVAPFEVRAGRSGRKIVHLVHVDRVGRGGGAWRASVGPVDVALDHPAARLEDASVMVAFHTARRRQEPLVVRGPGAGGAVTAAALVSAVLAAARPPSAHVERAPQKDPTLA